MRKNVLIVYNPKAGKNGAAHMLPQVVQRVRERGFRCVAYPILPGFGAEEIIDYEKGNFHHIVCCGGDGSLNHTINGLMQLEDRPSLIYLPTGSTNDFARSLELSKDIDIACSKLKNAQPFYYDIGKFNDTYFNYVAAFGAFTKVPYTTSQVLKNQLGHTAYIIEGIKHLPIGQYHTRTVISEERVLYGDFIYCSVSNSTSVGGILTLDPGKVDMKDGKLELLLVRAPRDLTELTDCIFAVTSQTYNCAMMTFCSTEHLKITAPETMPWTVDGEYQQGILQVDVSCVRHGIQIVKRSDL